MRRVLSTLAAFALILSVALPAFAAPPQISCTFLECCRAPCGTWCVDFNGDYQDCQTYVGACDGACDLSFSALSQTDAVGVDGAVEPLPFLSDPFLSDEAPLLLQTPAPGTGACTGAA